MLDIESDRVASAPAVDALTATYAQLRHAVETDVERAVERMAAFLMANRRFPPVMKWFSRAMGFSSSMSDTPPELLATVGVAYHQLGERFIAARMFDKAVEEAGDDGYRIVGVCFAAADDRNTADVWFREATKRRTARTTGKS
jgi:hypothetical protein